MHASLPIRRSLAVLFLLPLLLSSCKDGGPAAPSEGTVSGTVVSSPANTVLAGATISLLNGPSGTTNASGQFRFSAPTGRYEVTVSAPGYLPATWIGIEVRAGETTPFNLVTLQPAPPEPLAERYEIRLTWNPDLDLDAYLSGPRHNATNRFVVNWIAMGSLSNAPWAQLSMDDRYGDFGETITISRAVPGIYRYAVHEGEGTFTPGADALARSGARVRVTRGSQQIAEFAVPDQPGTLWTVFDLDALSGTITPVGTVSDLPPSEENLRPGGS